MTRRSTGSASWQPLSVYAATHMHEDVGDDRLDRALETAKGGLTPLPEHTKEVIALPVGAEPIRHAISPTGEVAVLYWRNSGVDEYRLLCLMRCKPNGERTHSQHFGTEKTIQPTAHIHVLYVAGSTDPVVIVGCDLYWADEIAVRLPIPWYTSVPELACLSFWEEDGRRHVAYIEDERDAVRFRFFTPGCGEGGSAGLRKRTSWLGVVGGSLARVVTEKTGMVLLWREIRVVMPNSNCHIINESISLVGEDGIQFAAWETGTRFRLFYVTPTVQTDRLVVESVVFWNHGQIYVKDARGAQHHLYRFAPMEVSLELFTTIRHPEQFPVGNGMRIHHFDDAAVVVDFTNAAKVNPERMLIGTKFRTKRPDTRDVQGVRRLHHGLAWHMRGKTRGFQWGVPTTDEDMARASFSLYGLDFNDLTAIEDEDGKAIINVDFTRHWIHIIRYPLPS